MMNERTAVVVEDDHDVGDVICSPARPGRLRRGIVAHRVPRRSRWSASTRPDLVTLDLTLPDIDGVEVCRQIRTVSDCYVIVVSGRASEVDRLVGLEVGADDYLVQAVLDARAAGQGRRPLPSSAQCRADFRPHLSAVEATSSEPVPSAGVVGLQRPAPSSARRARCEVAASEIDLTRTEFDLLAHLVGNPGVVVPREQLMRDVWAGDFVPDSTHVVDVHLANLRRKLRVASGNQWIRTIRGVGFRFDPCCP